ncbi:hypothetical protein [uncultured Paraglaciecola sp.]|uniref:hypothetical protein n=1 Tax=uncultured Paraglaciecola sp. TaxID=1765024 RepID=UPI0026138433|nr:hypothetical protein [uncultured Paraglaciecola sp.]
MKELTQEQINVLLTERNVKAVDTARAMMKKSKDQAERLKTLLLMQKMAANDSNYKRWV